MLVVLVVLMLLLRQADVPFCCCCCPLCWLHVVDEVADVLEDGHVVAEVDWR